MDFAAAFANPYKLGERSKWLKGEISKIAKRGESKMISGYVALTKPITAIMDLCRTVFDVAIYPCLIGIC